MNRELYSSEVDDCIYMMFFKMCEVEEKSNPARSSTPELTETQMTASLIGSKPTVQHVQKKKSIQAVTLLVLDHNF